MADASLKARLQDHAEAFDGLLSLIPAKIYYGNGDSSDQWKRKKQTKAQADAALRAKLDPDSIKTAKDVMDEKAARKRKLDDIDDTSDIEGVEKELPKQGMRDGEKKNGKKLKKDAAVSSTTPKPEENQARTAAAEKRREKAEKKKKEKKARKAEKINSKRQDAFEDEVVQDSGGNLEAKAEANAEDAPAEDEDWIDVGTEAMNPISIHGLVEEEHEAATGSPSSVETRTFESNDQSANTSTSSVIPPAKAPKHIKLPSDPELLRKRLAAKIESLRAARKADGPNGAPARNRQELIDSRRKKEEQRRAHKKELRRLAAIEEANKREEALESARHSPASSIMGSRRHSPEHSLSFGRVAFGDGHTLTADLSTLVAPPKKKGPQDAGTALDAAEHKRQRLAGLDDATRAEREAKEAWRHAAQRARGERVRDDASLLKKTLQRRERAKRKSEKEWSERAEGVARGVALKQRKREENLQKRKEGKGGGGGGGAKQKKKKKGKAPLKRPGFEGSFTTKKR